MRVTDEMTIQIRMWAMDHAVRIMTGHDTGGFIEVHKEIAEGLVHFVMNPPKAAKST